MRKFTKILIVGLALVLGQIAIQAQTNGSVSGVVTDPQKELVAGAVVTVKNDGTGQQFTAVTNSEGYFRIPAVAAGIYTATITGKGFKKSIVTAIKVDVGSGSNINVQLEVGGATEQVTVVGGGELLKTENATIGSTLTGRQITDIPTASRDALDLVLALPGTGTPGRPRTSSVNGLPKGALNITLDGINVQDNLLKSSDGFFTYVRPRTDAVSEVTISTSTPGAESNGEGAVQIKFVTQGGSNEYHGGGYWYHRNPALNANYWFNNRDLAPDFVTGKAPSQRILLNQPGFKIGGPISIPWLFNGKDKAFFFVNYEEYRLPERSSPRTRTLLNPLALTGIHQFTATAAYAPPANVTCVTSGTGKLCQVNVFTLAAAAGLPVGVDPTVSALLASERSALAGVNAIFKDVGGSTPSLQQATFFNPGGQKRTFPTVRFDFNLTKNHHIENIWNYQQFRSQVDFLNSVDPAFPGFPNYGSQDSNRFSDSMAWRWTISPTMVNELRYGLTGGTALFFPQVAPSQFANQGGVSLPGIGGSSSATVTTGPSRRNTPVKQLIETLTWIRGDHTINFGGTFTKISSWQQNITVVPSVGFGISSTLAGDAAAFGAFSSLQPSVSQQASAAALYAGLVGRMNSVSANVRLDENTDKYAYLGSLIQRSQQKEFGIFAQDTWRFRPNITFTGGVRWEVQLPFEVLNGNYAALTDVAGVFGESGLNNLFKPGTLTGQPTAYKRLEKGSKAYNADYGNFAPSIGFTYSPNFKEGVLHALAGNAGQTVFRGGFSMAFVREGIASFGSIYAANPGGLLTANVSTSNSPYPICPASSPGCATSTFGLLFRNGLPARPPTPAAPTYPNVGLITDGANAFDPNMKTGYVESWSAGIQREINANTVVELRYVGNRGHQLWRQLDLNEVNVMENGFLNEFNLAQKNLLSNIACGNTVGCVGGGLNFRYRGPGTGTFPLPIILGYFAGLPVNNPANAANPANYSSTLFANSSFTTPLNPLNGNPLGFAGTISSTANESLFNGPRIAAGIPYNFFVVNPGKRGGAFYYGNGGQTWYDGVTIELRRRLAKGLLVQSSYTFSKALSNTYASNSDTFDQPPLHDTKLRKSVTPFDITQAFKTNFIYELPVGRGRSFLGNAGKVVNGVLGGWAFNGNIRIQSGSPFNFGNVQLVGITAKELQKAVGVYRGEADADGVVRGNVFILPLAIRQNTYKANNRGFASGTNLPFFSGIGGDPTGQYIAPAGLNCNQGVVGHCGFNNLVLKGPSFFRYDLSISKKVRFRESLNLEMRAEFLNAFNNINWIVGGAGNDVNGLGGLGATTFGRYTAAYQDISTTNDPGGRLVQLVLRLNF